MNANAVHSSKHNNIPPSPTATSHRLQLPRCTPQNHPSITTNKPLTNQLHKIAHPILTIPRLWIKRISTPARRSHNRSHRLNPITRRRIPRFPTIYIPRISDQFIINLSQRRNLVDARLGFQVVVVCEFQEETSCWVAGDVY
jgi:hypothetical protein